MLIDVIEFNRKRNGFKLDVELELSMLKEEVQEFFDATTTAERLDAYIDTEYVYNGTKMKIAYNVAPVNPDLEKWIDDSLTLMYRVLKEEGIGDLTIANARKIVADINALKINKLDENGKVMKQEDLPNATEEIAKLLKEI